MTKIRIVGAGLAGLIAGTILRSDADCILESQSEVPNNHSALLRFKSSVVGDAVGIPFQKVKVLKSIHQPVDPVRDSMAYSAKVTGQATLRSIITAGGGPEDRYIAPDDFIQQLVDRQMAPIHFNNSMIGATGVPTISTIPMPALMDVLGWDGPRPEFRSRPGWTVTVDLPKAKVDACVTMYLPEPLDPIYRISVTRSHMIIEGVGDVEGAIGFTEKNSIGIYNALNILGLSHINADEISTPVLKAQKYAKILPIDDGLRKRFILWASERHNVYSLGRFATWRPGLLLDALVNDVRIIQRMVNGDSSTPYSARKS